MDDYKRSIYMEVQRRLRLPWSAKNEIFICCLLQEILEQDGSETVSQSILRELFPEFYNLFDGYCYKEYDLKIYEKKEVSMMFEPWWGRHEIKPRIRIIDYLLQA